MWIKKEAQNLWEGGDQIAFEWVTGRGLTLQPFAHEGCHQSLITELRVTLLLKVLMMSPFSLFLYFWVSVFVSLLHIEDRSFVFRVSCFASRISSMYLFSFFVPQLHIKPNLELARIPLYSFEITQPTGTWGQLAHARFVQVLQSQLYFELPQVTFCLYGFLVLEICNDIVFNLFLCVLILYSFLTSAFS